MSSVEYLREFINERLIVAAEEIFGVFEKTIVEYEEEIDRQRKLLDIVWKPAVKLHRIELPLQYVCQDKRVLANQQLSIQEWNSSLDQEDSEPPQIKEEQDESDHSEDLDLNHTLTLNVAEETVVNIFEVPEPSDHQLLSHNFHVTESQNQNRGEPGESGSIRNTEPGPKKSQEHRNNVFAIHPNTSTNKPFPLHICEVCGKDFDIKSKLDRHLRAHTDEKPYFCNTCEKRFKDLQTLRRHQTIHTGERPYSCKICGKTFRLNSDVKVHIRTHTGEKRFKCNTCGKRYCRMIDLRRHSRIHTIQYICQDKEVFADQELCIQEMNSSLDREDPEPPQIKEEEEELCTSQGEQFEVKQEIETFTLTPTYEESDHNEDQTLDFNPDNSQSAAETELPAGMCVSWIKDEPDQENPEVSEPNSNSDETLNAAEKKSVVNISVKSSVVPEQNSDHQLLSHNSHVHQSQDQKEGKNDSNKSHSNSVCKIHWGTCTGQKIPVHICDICGKDFYTKTRLKRHLRVHTNEKPFFCNICGKCFNDTSTLRRHKNIHTGEKPHLCKTCGKTFRMNHELKLHSRTHTGEKRFNCNTCGTRYGRMIDLKRHSRIHASEKQRPCKIQESSVETSQST